MIAHNLWKIAVKYCSARTVTSIISVNNKKMTKINTCEAMFSKRAVDLRMLIKFFQCSPPLLAEEVAKGALQCSLWCPTSDHERALEQRIKGKIQCLCQLQSRLFNTLFIPPFNPIIHVAGPLDPRSKGR